MPTKNKITQVNKQRITAGFFCLKVYTLLIQIIPWSVHRFFSRLLYVLIFYVVGYRKKVVSENLRNAFPRKDANEISNLSKKFYGHFSRMFVETLYLAGMPEKRLKKWVAFENTTLLDELYRKDKSIIVVLGHHFNWEFLTALAPQVKHKVFFVYQRLSNRTFDQFYAYLRQRFGAGVLERKEAPIRLMRNINKSPSMTFFLSDQSPIKEKIQYWTSFLNQDTPIVLGPEKIAKKTNSAVVFLSGRKEDKRKYVFSFQLIEENPVDTDTFEITEKHVRLLEKSIVRYPEFWLWSHRRWKHKRS